MPAGSVGVETKLMKTYRNVDDATVMLLRMEPPLPSMAPTTIFMTTPGTVAGVLVQKMKERWDSRRQVQRAEALEARTVEGAPQEVILGPSVPSWGKARAVDASRLRSVVDFMLGGGRVFGEGNF